MFLRGKLWLMAPAIVTRATHCATGDPFAMGHAFAMGDDVLDHGPRAGPADDRIQSRRMSGNDGITSAKLRGVHACSAAKRLVALACLLNLVGCSLLAPKFNRPNITVASIELRSGNLLQQNFAVKLDIQNPNARALPVKGLHVELSAGGVQIASGVSDHDFVVPPFGDSQFDMTIKANLGAAVLLLANKLDQHADSVAYDLTGSASIDLPFLRDLPFHQTGSFSLHGIQ